jgi:hypothetical protein
LASKPRVNQSYLRTDGRMMQAVLRGNELHQLVGALDVRRASAAPAQLMPAGSVIAPRPRISRTDHQVRLMPGALPGHCNEAGGPLGETRPTAPPNSAIARATLPGGRA